MQICLAAEQGLLRTGGCLTPSHLPVALRAPMMPKPATPLSRYEDMCAECQELALVVARVATGTAE